MGAALRSECPGAESGLPLLPPSIGVRETPDFQHPRVSSSCLRISKEKGEGEGHFGLTDPSVVPGQSLEERLGRCECTHCTDKEIVKSLISGNPFAYVNKET